MTLTQMKYAIAVADTGSMNEAARSLFIAPPSLSASIRELEQEIGIELFKRTSRGVLATPEGEEFLGYARQVTEQYRLLESRYIEKKKKIKKKAPPTLIILLLVRKEVLENVLSIFYVVCSLKHYYANEFKKRERSVYMNQKKLSLFGFNGFDGFDRLRVSNICDFEVTPSVLFIVRWNFMVFTSCFMRCRNVYSRGMAKWRDI